MMKNLRFLFRGLLIRLHYHLEHWGLISSHYPKQIVQRRFRNDDLIFEVHNLTEANRVQFLDDEDEFLSSLLFELQSMDIFFDIGACIGLFSIHAAKRCNRVFAFEPDPGFRGHLERNIRINALTNLTTLPYAISDKSGFVTLFTDGIDGKSPSLENNNFTQGIEVESKSLSELVLNDLLPAPTVIKMDIEGAEILALRGMQDLIRKNPPRLIFLELHPILVSHFGSNAAEVLSILQAASYGVRWKSERDEQIHYVFELMNLNIR
jgi:FkbM family methyltransferase